MDPSDHLGSPPAAVDCAVCRSRVDGTRLRLLAEREDLAFVEIDCTSCGSVTLGMVLQADDTIGRRRLDDAGHAELRPDEEVRLLGAPPIGADDVLDMHLFLAGHAGGLANLLGAAPGQARDPEGLGA